MKTNIIIGKSIREKIKDNLYDEIFLNVKNKTNTCVDDVINDIIVTEIYNKTIIRLWKQIYH